MGKSRRRLTLLVIIGSVVALFLLAAGLPGLEFRAGHPFLRFRQGKGLPPNSRGYFRFDHSMDATMALLFLGLFLLAILACLLLIFSPEGRRKALGWLFFLFLILATYLLLRPAPVQSPQHPPLATSLPSGQRMPPPTPEVVAGDLTIHPPSWAVLVMAACLAVLLAAGLVGLVWLVWSYSRQPVPLLQLAGKAQEAVEALEAGADVQDTVLRCYFSMDRLLRQWRGIRREEAMTPREFEKFLAAAGLPEGPVARLTRLFEAVRYGARVPAEEEGQQAVACLMAIAEACRRAA